MIRLMVCASEISPLLHENSLTHTGRQRAKVNIMGYMAILKKNMTARFTHP
jgi:hypothetical protein